MIRFVGAILCGQVVGEERIVVSRSETFERQEHGEIFHAVLPFQIMSKMPGTSETPPKNNMHMVERWAARYTWK